MASKRAILPALAVFMLAVLLGYTGPAQAAPSPEPFRYVPETGHNIGLQIKAFYERYGGLRIFGLPLTEAIEENGRIVQYFERARFELHPENSPEHYVQLTLLGRILTEGRSDPAFAPAAPGDPRISTYFPQTGHNLSQGFRSFWQQNGGLPIFGYPISEEFEEVSPTDGKVYTVQYFERARFEWHPEYGVELGLLGSEYAQRIGLAESLRARAAPIVKLGEATTGYNGSSQERVNNIARAAERFDGLRVKPGEIFSFLQNVGDISEQAGFVEGYAIVRGKLEKAVGGGVCQVSTTLYRAVFRAGLEIVERHPHSYVVYFYENIPGFDATVFLPYIDFRWRNDTPHDIYISTETNIQRGTVTFTLWGIGDGRKTTMTDPEVKNVRQPGPATWQFDKRLAKGEIVQIVHGRPGMDVEIWRTVTKADGSVLRKERFPTKYKPWEDYFLYGPGVTPPPGVIIAPPLRP